MEPLFSKDPNDLLEEKMMDNIETARESLCRNNTFSNMDGSVEQRVCLEESSCYATSDFETTEKEEVNSIDNYKDVFTVKPESLTNFPENKTTTKLTFNPEDLDDAIMKEESVEVTGKVKQIQSQETKQTNEAEFMLEALPNACLILLSKVEPMEEKFFYAEGSSYSPCRLKKKKIEPCRVILGDYSLSEFQKCSETFRSVVPKEEFTAHKEELKEFKLEFPQKETKESNQMEVELEVAYDAGKVLAKKVEAEEEKFRAEECSLFTCPTTKYESGVVKMDPIKELPKSGCIHNFRKDLKKVDIISTKNEKLVDTEELKQVKPGFPEEETKASNQMEFKVEPASGPSTGFVNQVEPVVERATLQKRSSRCVTWKCENFHSMKTEPCFDLQENESVSKVWRNSERIIDKIEKEESVVQTEEFEPLKSDYPQDKIEASDQIELAQEVVSVHTHCPLEEILQADLWTTLHTFLDHFLCYLAVSSLEEFRLLPIFILQSTFQL
ncbi:uncharacterized protein LOC106456920 isoform X2 [Limulus polyphemus]|uniref:Uncharacterized protein LOC106456920 isoform X2 n=1 Tax=Limulus polyphemus TaxID=6850 RepID=A0ABM1S458_LIMPO|nr:uncharacterized protein LOC106456920 isoform X2 [Limulus polyphemus]